MKVVGYCRFSSEGQREGYSIEAQKRAIIDYAARENMDLIDWYVDEARSATSDDRDAFQAMISDAYSRKFKAVIVHKLDRFSRDRYDSAIYKKKLKDCGVKLISVLERLDGSPESIMMESLLEGMAEYYSKNLSREVLKGKREAARKAQHNGGLPPYGLYVKDDMTYGVVVEEAIVIKDIFAKYTGGYSSAAIARYLSNKGLRNRSGHRFNREYVTRILKNSLYKGQYVYGRRSKKIDESAADLITIDNALEAIISPALFDQAQKLLDDAANKYKPPRSRLSNKTDEYILTGYVYCGFCGSHLYGFRSSRKYKSVGGADREYSSHFYRCARKAPREYVLRDKTQACEFKNMKKDMLEPFVIKAVETIVFSEEHLRDLVSKLKNFMLKENKDHINADDVSKELDKIKKQQDRLLDLYLNGSIEIPDYNSRKRELESQLEYYSKKIPVTQANPDKITYELLKRVIEKFLSKADADSIEYRKMMLHTFVKSVVLDNINIVIYFKFPLPGLGSHSDFVCNTATTST